MTKKAEIPWYGEAFSLAVSTCKTFAMNLYNCQTILTFYRDLDYQYLEIISYFLNSSPKQIYIKIYVWSEATLVSTIQTDWVAEFKPTMVSSGKVQTRQLKLCS